MDRQPRGGQRHRAWGSSTYGASPANPGLSATGLQNGQNASVLTGLSNSFGIGSASNAGDYTLSVAGLLTNTNYTVTSTNTGTWTVNPAAVSVTALGGSSTYGASPAKPRSFRDRPAERPERQCSERAVERVRYRQR